MTLDDVFTQLVHGELRHLFVSVDGDTAAALPDNKRVQILASVELGLLDLYKRFLLKENTITLNLVPGKQSYLLDMAYAQSNTRSQATVKYINDIDSPFTNDLFKVERVYDEAGVELAINDVDNPDSVKTPTLSMVVLPDTLIGSTVKVVYRAGHGKLDKIMAAAAPTQVSIGLPMPYLDLLLLYVAARVTTPVGMSQEFHEGNNYLAKYEAAVEQMTNNNFTVKGSNESTRFRDRGWC